MVLIRTVFAPTRRAFGAEIVSDPLLDRVPLPRLAEVPIKMSESPAYIGGRIDRGAPCYGEDNEYVYGELLGMSSPEIKDLAAEGVI